MKKLLFAIVCLLYVTSSHAGITYYQDGQTLFANFVCSETDSLTYELIRNDYFAMVDVADSKKCKTLIVLYADNNLFYMTDVASNKMYPDTYYKKIEDAIHSFDETVKTGGELIRVDTIVHHEPAKYVVEDYINGKLYSTYESEWELGPFAEKRSTTRYEDGDVFLSITKYVAPVTTVKKEEIRKPVKTTKVPNLNKFREKYYIIKSPE